MPAADSTPPARRYPQRLSLRTPVGLMAALELAAERHHTSPAEYARQALLRALRQDGVRLASGSIEAD